MTIDFEPDVESKIDFEPEPAINFEPDFDPRDEEQVNALAADARLYNREGQPLYREDHPNYREPITDKKKLKALRGIQFNAVRQAAQQGDEQAQQIVSLNAAPMKAALESVRSSVEPLQQLGEPRYGIGTLGDGNPPEVYSGPPEGLIGPAPTVLGEIGRGNVGRAAGMAGRLLREEFSGLIGPTEEERLANSIPVTQPDGSVSYEYKPLGDRLTREGGMMTSPTPFQPLAHTENEGIAAAVGKAAFNTVGGIASGFMSPLGALLPGAGEVPVLARVGSGLFAADMASHIPEQLGQIASADTYGEAAEGILGAGTSALMATGAGGHALKKSEPPTRSRLLFKGDSVPHDRILDADWEAGRTPDGWRGDAPPEPLFHPEAVTPEITPVTPEVTAPRAVPVDLAPVVAAADMPLTAEAIRREPVAAPKPDLTESFLADIEKLANEQETPAGETAAETPATAGEVPSAIEAPREEAAGEVPALTPEQESEWRAMQEEHEAEMRGALDEAPGSHELLSAVKSLGGLPAAERDTSLTGETKRLWEASKGRMMKLVNGAQKKSLDAVREGLAQYGFNFDTPHAMLEALENRITTGREVRGFEPGDGMFASKSEPSRIAGTAVLLTDGRIIRGDHPNSIHASIVDKIESMDLPEGVTIADEGGFVALDGSFLTRAEATALSQAGIKSLGAEHLTKAGNLSKANIDRQRAMDAGKAAEIRARLKRDGWEDDRIDAHLRQNGLLASKSEPAFDPPMRAAYDRLVNRDRFRFPAVSIGELAKESGVPLADMKAKLYALHKQGRVVLSIGDWSLSSPTTRAGMIDVPGIGRATQVRPLDVMSSKTPARAEDAFSAKLRGAYRNAPPEATLDAQGKRPSTVDFERPSGIGKLVAQNTKEALRALAEKHGVSLRTTEGERKSHHEAVVQEVDRLKRQFPGVGLEVYRNQADNQALSGRLNPGEIYEGVYDAHSGKVSIFSDNISSPQRAMEVFAHEVVGHYGVGKLVGEKEFSAIAKTVLRDAPGIAEKIARSYTKKGSLFRESGKLSDLTPEERATVAREYVARLAEKPAINPALWQRIVATVRRALKALGIQREWSNADIRDLIRRAVREVERDDKAPEAQRSSEVRESKPDMSGERLVGSIDEDFSTRGKRVTGEMDANEDHGKLGVKGDHRFRFQDGKMSWYHWPGEDLAREAEAFARKKMGTEGEIRHEVSFPQGGPKERVLSDVRASIKDLGEEVSRLAPKAAAIEAAFEKAVPEERRDDVSRYVADTLAGRPTVDLTGREKNFADRSVRLMQDLKSDADAAGVGNQVMDAYRAALSAKPDMTLPERIATFTAETERAKRGAVEGAVPPAGQSAPVDAPPAAPEAPAGDSGETTALKRAVVDLQREVRGGEDIPVPIRVDSEELIRQAGEAVSGDPGMAARIVARILSTEHHDDLAVSRRDAAVMLVERTRLRNERAAAQVAATDANALPEQRAQAASDLAYAGEQIDRLDQASRAAGTAWSDFGRLYQQVQRSDFSIESVKRRMESAKRAPIDPESEEMKGIQHDVSEIEKGEEAAKKRTEEIQAENSRQAAADYLAGLEPTPRASRAVLDLAEKIVRKLESAADAARARIRERMGKASAGVDPTVLYDVAVIGLSKLGRATLDFAHWSAEMVDEFDAMDFDVRPYLNDAWTKTQELWAAEEKKMTGSQRERVTKARTKRVDILSDRLGIYDGIKAAVKEGATLGEGADKYVKLYVKNLVDSGVRGLDPVMDRVMQDLGPLFPDATRRQLMDAFSDYGKSTPATKKEADIHRAEIRREAQLTSAIKDVEAGIAPAATGKRRNPLSVIGRALTRALNEAKRRYNIQPADPAAALRSALDARKTYYRNRMQDLSFEIARKERVIREKSLSPTDAELDSLKAAYELVKADHEAVFGKREMTDEQRLQQAVKIAERNEKIAAEQLAKAKRGIFEGPRKAGVKPSVELEAIRARAEAMRAETAELKSQALGLDAAKREAALTAKIEDLNGKLMVGDIDAQAAGARVEPSARAAALKAEYDAMRGLLADLRRDADPKRAPDAVEARKLAKLNKEIDALDAKIQAGDVSVRARRPVNDSADAEFLKAQRAAMAKHLAEMRRLSSRTVMTPEERALKAYGTRLANTEADLAARNLRADAGDATAFRRKPRQPVDISRDPTLVAQKVRVEEAKTNLARREAAFEKAHRNRLEKILEGISGWRRAFVLSGVHTLAKLTSAAGEIITIAPIEEAVGGVLGKLPFIRRAAEQAPRHGGFSPRAEWEAIAETTTKLFKDAGDYMKRGATDLDSVYGKPRIEPFEFKELLGRMHGALKTPARRNEWTRSYRKRMEFAAKAGADISSPLVQTRIGLEAYEDASRSIFMESNMVVEAYKRALSRFAQKDESGHASVAGKIAETTARVLVPIVKIPTNLVARTFEYTFGSVTGLTRLGFALARGIDTLPPEQADIIMRNLKRGSLGAAVLAIGYLNPDSIGGYYNGPNDAGDVKHGEIELYGHSIPKVLIHNPLLEQLQIGATIRRVADSKLKKSDHDTQGIGVGAVAASLGVLKEVPFLNVVNRTGEAIRDSESFGTYAGDQLRGLVVPQGVDEAARFFDKDANGETVKRSPKTILERIQSSIPFYRNDLPEKRKKR